MKLLLGLLLCTQAAWSYVPTVESLFRNGSNPDINGNVAIVNLKITKMDPSGMMQEEKNNPSEYYRVYYTKLSDEVIKLNQFKYSNDSFQNEGNIVHRAYYPNFNSYSLANQPNALEKSMFYGILHSLALQNGEFLVSYLKSLGLPLKLNKEIINREKIGYLAQYKQYLMTINQDKEVRKTLENPLRPSDPEKREKIEKIMNESMYTDTHQVTLAKDVGEMSWKVSVKGFEATVSYAKRYLQKLTFKGSSGDLEFLFKDYALINATHIMPKQILIRDLNGDNYQVDILGLRYSSFTDAAYVRKLKEWDKNIKPQSVEVLRPGFML